MISPTTVARLARLSLWRPPPGVSRVLVVHDDGTIAVILHAGRCQEQFTLCPCCPTTGIAGKLDEAAARLVAALDRAAARAEERRVERTLEAARARFAEGLDRATGKGG
jgi:hypothetical protein